MALTDGKGPVTSSYIDSTCVLTALFVACSSIAALIFALLLIRVITITIVETTMQRIKAIARELMDIKVTVLVSVAKEFVLFTLIGSLMLPVIFPHTTVCTASVHVLPSINMSVQVTVVWLVVVGQLPQFDARML